MMNAAEPEVRFDRIVISDAEGQRELSTSQFLGLPLTQRIRCVIERTVRFYWGTQEIDRHAAINAMRRDQVR